MRFLLLLLTPLIMAGPADFSVTSPASGDPEEEATLIVQLRQTAVTNYLTKQLGPSSAQVISLLKPDMTEGFVRDYQVGHAPGRLTMTGRLDTDAIRRWARVVQTKQTNILKPCVLVTSSINGHVIVPADYPARLRESALLQLTHSEISSILKKYGTKPADFPNGFSDLSSPPLRASQIRSLKDFVGEACNTALWVHYLSCASCGGVRMDSYLYNLTQMRQAAVSSENVALSGQDALGSAKVKSAVQPAFAELKKLIDETLSRGVLFSVTYQVVFAGLKSYTGYKALEDALQQLEAATKVQLKRAQAHEAEFEILSAVSPEQLAKQIQETSVKGLALKSPSVDGARISFAIQQ